MTVTALEADLNWRLRGACTGADPDLFVGPEGETRRERNIREAEAVKVCATCPVTAECLEYALGKGVEYGVWAGLGEMRIRKLFEESGRVRESVIDITTPRSARERAEAILAAGEKSCSRCDEVKPLEDFRRAKGNSDGYSSACKQCLTAAYPCHTKGVAA